MEFVRPLGLALRITRQKWTTCLLRFSSPAFRFVPPNGGLLVGIVVDLKKAVEDGFVCIFDVTHPFFDFPLALEILPPDD